MAICAIALRSIVNDQHLRPPHPSILKVCMRSGVRLRSAHTRLPISLHGLSRHLDLHKNSDVKVQGLRNEVNRPQNYMRSDNFFVIEGASGAEKAACA